MARKTTQSSPALVVHLQTYKLDILVLNHCVLEWFAGLLFFLGEIGNNGIHSI